METQIFEWSKTIVPGTGELAPRRNYLESPNFGYDTSTMLGLH